jgi:hypothetical protein
MADVTPAKRVLPARDRRESAAKRYSPAPPTVTRRKVPTKSSAPSTPATEERTTRKTSRRAVRSPTPEAVPTPPPEDTLPTKVTSSRPLPTTKQKQASKLFAEDYQSVAESAILAASLHRSRMQWLSDGIFKKYWVKPVKRKGVIEQPPNNPDVKTMTRLGTGAISAEPHKFEVTFYTVKEALPMQYKPPVQVPPRVPAPQPSPPGNTPYKPTTPASTVQAGVAVPAPSQQATTVKQEPTVPPTKPATPSVPIAKPATPSVPPSQQTVQATPPPPKTNSDPVIQMLAARAATDPHLKELMKVVATSKANAEQLKEFQKHIDEFNAVVKKQELERLEAEKRAKAQASAPPVQAGSQQQQPPPSTVAPSSAVPSPASTPAQVPPGTATPSPAPGTTPFATPGAAHPSVYNTSAPRPPPPVFATYPSPRPMQEYIKHIILEFHGESATTDRFVFPAYAALDMKPGGLEMLTSFFVERKGSDLIASIGESNPEDLAATRIKWQADVEYYQPVTIMVRANQHKTIETIARAAKTLPEVQSYMRHVITNKTRAPTEYLVHQLPREKGVAESEMPSADLVDSGVDMGSDEAEDDELKPWYGNA